MYFYEENGIIQYLVESSKLPPVPVDVGHFLEGETPEESLCSIVNFLNYDSVSFLNNISDSLNEDYISQQNTWDSILRILSFAIAKCGYSEFVSIIIAAYLSIYATLDYSNSVLCSVKKEKSQTMDDYYSSMNPNEYLFFTSGIKNRLTDGILAASSYADALLAPDTPLGSADDKDNEMLIKVFSSQHIQYYVFPTNDGRLIKLYKIKDGDLKSYLFFILGNQIKNICCCRNCGRLFVPTLRKEEIYCNHKNANGKTCKEIGYENTMDDIDKAYRKAYKTKNAFKNRSLKLGNNPNIQNSFDAWVEEAQYLKGCLKDGTITEDEYYKHLEKKLK